MKKTALIVVLIVILGTLFASEGQQKAGDFQLEDSEGNLVRLSELNDKLVLIDFWATWCVPCKKELPHLSAIQDKYAEKLEVLAINIDKPRMQAKAKAYVKSNGYNFRTLYDPEGISLDIYNVVNPPRTILIAPGMQIVYTHDGYKRGDEVEIEEMVKKWLDHQPEEAVHSKTEKEGEFYIGGINKMQYVYRTAEDSLHHYLDDELSFSATYNRFRFGMTYRGELPEYDRFAPEEKLSNADLHHEWTERFAEYNGDKFSLRAGNFETVFGSGMVIHAYNNTDMNEDERLEGAIMQAKYDRLRFQAIYGSLENENYSSYNDIVTGADMTFNLLKAISLGGSALSYRSYIAGDEYEYNQRDVFSGRAGLSTKLIELDGEYAYSSKYRDIVASQKGRAFYGNMNLYLGKIRFTTAYKNYNRFSERLVELPTVNHCEEPIAEYGVGSIPGYDEEGLQGIVFWTPSEKKELELNYSEGWARETDIYQSDFYGSYKQDFSALSIHLEYVQMERIDESAKEYKWDKESKPSIEADFMMKTRPVLVKFEWKRMQYDNYGNKATTDEPLFQIDYGFYKNYSLSLMASIKYSDTTSISESQGKAGVELFAPVWEHTDIRLFAGSEKGGKVCRNGVCNYQSPFEGLRLEVTTRF